MEEDVVWETSGMGCDNNRLWWGVCMACVSRVSNNPILRVSLQL